MEEYEIFIGSYAERSEESILRYAVDFENLTFKKLGGIRGLSNPSYLCLNEEKNLLYAVEEDAPLGSLALLSLHGNEIEIISETTTKGADPAHVSIDEQGQYLAVMNYSVKDKNGSVALFKLDENGNPNLQQILYHTGHGINAERQLEPHPHFSNFAGDRLMVCDLGVDTVYQYGLDRKKGLLELTDGSLKLSPGSGPRHLCFGRGTAEWMYVICELDAHVRVFQMTDGKYVLKQTIDTLPEGISPKRREKNVAAAIKMSDDGDYLFVSNRGEDTITVFSVEKDHCLKLVDIQKTGSEVPRDMVLLGDYVLIGHQGGNCITAMKFNRRNKKLDVLDMRLNLDISPVCILKC